MPPVPDVVLDLIGRDNIGQVWSLIEPLLAQSLRRSPNCDLTPAYVKDMAEAGRFFVWAAYRKTDPTDLLGIAVTGVIGTDCHCFALAGHGFRDWADVVFPEFHELARAHGMKRVVFDGRPGWRRVLARYGYRPTPLGMEKDLAKDSDDIKPVLHARAVEGSAAVSDGEHEDGEDARRGQRL